MAYPDAGRSLRPRLTNSCEDQILIWRDVRSTENPKSAPPIDDGIAVTEVAVKPQADPRSPSARLAANEARCWSK